MHLWTIKELKGAAKPKDLKKHRDGDANAKVLSDGVIGLCDVENLGQTGQGNTYKAPRRKPFAKVRQ